MEVSVRKYKKHMRATVRGDLTIYTALEMKQAMLGPVTSELDIDLDLSHVHALDTAGLQLILVAARELAEGGRKLSVVSPSPEALEALKACCMVEQLCPAVSRVTD